MLWPNYKIGGAEENKHAVDKGSLCIQISAGETTEQKITLEDLH